MTSLGKTGRYVYLVRELGCEQLHTFPVKKKKNPYKLTLRRGRGSSRAPRASPRVPNFWETVFHRVSFSRFQHANMRKGHYCAFHKHANSEFKSQLTIAFFAAVNHLNGPLRNKTLL